MPECASWYRVDFFQLINWLCCSLTVKSKGQLKKINFCFVFGFGFCFVSVSANLPIFFLFQRFSNLESNSCQLSVLISPFPRFGNPEPGSCLLSFSKVLVIQRPDILSERAGYVRSDPTTSAQCSFDPWTSTFEFDGLPTELPSYLVQGSIKMQELTAKMQIISEINIII